MDKSLSQDEVDALLQAVRSGKVEESAPAPEPQAVHSRTSISSYDFRKPRLVSNDHVLGFKLIHAAFAKRMSGTVSSMLKVSLDAKTASVENISFNEFTAGMMNPTFVVTAGVSPHSGEIAIEISLPILFTLLDAMLGIPASAAAPESREPTAIEKSLAGGIVDIMLADLHEAWAGVSDMHFKTRTIESNPEFARVAAADALVLCATLDLRCGETAGTINICYPLDVILPVLSKVAAKFSGKKSAGTVSVDGREIMLRSLAAVPFEIKAHLGSGRIPTQQISRLKLGSVICLDSRTDDPIMVQIGAKPCYNGALCSSRSRVAVRVVSRVENSRDDNGGN